MKSIPLTKGRYALVDDSDYERVNQFKWHVIDNSGWRATRVAKVNGRLTTINMSRFILGCTDPKLFVDHINHDTLDNRRENLRICTARENQWNKSRQRNKKSSPFKGVFVRRVGDRVKISAAIRINGRLKHLGYFKTPEEAARAYDRAATMHYGDFACLNKPFEALALVA